MEETILEKMVSFFDLQYMVLLFLVSQVLIKNTKLNILKANYKRLIVLIMGVAIASLLTVYRDQLNVHDTSFVDTVIRYVISTSVTVLFYDFIYRKITDKLK